MKHSLDDNTELKSTEGVDFTEQERYSFFESIAAAKAIEYKQKRANEYPSIGDQLDALWKGGDAAAEMLAKVQAVKSKYPKPE